MKRLIELMSLAVLLVAPVAAQQYRADVRGTVFNAEGTPAPAIGVTFIREDTGESRRVVSAADGSYTVAGLLPGTYRIEATDAATPQFAVRTGASIAHDMRLDLRLGTVPITVEADVRPTFLAIDRQSPAIDTRLEGSFLTRLPFDGRSFLDATLIAPGMLPGSTGVVASGTDALFTSYIVDGIYDIDPRLGIPAVRLQLDSIDELEVRSWPFDASFGRTAGPQVNVVTRSGTNQPGGGATGFFRSSEDALQLAGFAGGPLATNRTFVFGNYELTGRDEATFDDPSHLLSARVDQIVNGSARLIGRYGFDRLPLPDRTGQLASGSFHTAIGSAVNESRAGMTRVSVEGTGLLELLESTTYQLANDTSVPLGAHLVTAGAEWYGVKSGFRSDGLTATQWGLFVQDDWRALPRLSIAAGVRFDRAAVSRTDVSESNASPRVGAVWSADPEAQTLVRAGYGRYRNFTMFEGTAPALDAWTFSIERQIGRARSFEAAYVATRGEHMRSSDRSRYDALQLQFEQRSETGIAAVVSYTVGKWVEEFGTDGPSVRAPFDSRHRLVAAFVVLLPFGKDQRLFADGLAAAILGDMELTGIATVQSGRAAADLDANEPAYRSMDAALVKSIALADRRSLQLRAESFNLIDRDNPFGRGRRYQLGARFVF
jgi:hypothetical protein